MIIEKKYDYSKIIKEAYEKDCEIIKENKDIVMVEEKEKKQVLILEKVKYSAWEIMFFYSIIEKLYENNFYNVPRIYANINKKPYIGLDGEIYILKDFIDGDQFKCKDKDNLDKLIIFLSEFHKSTSNFEPLPGSKISANWGKWIGSIKNQILFLKKYKNIVIEKDVKTNFDNLFLKEVDNALGILEKILIEFEKIDYTELIKSSMKEKQICINEINTNNLVIKNNEIYLKGIERCVYDLKIIDIAKIFTRLVKYDWNKEDIYEAIELYKKQNIIEDSESKLIFLFISQPQEFYKISKKYYDRKNTAEESYLLKKLNESIEMIVKKQQFIEKDCDFK